MKKMLAALLFILGSVSGFGQGTVNFVNRIVGVVDAPIFDIDGTTRLSGSAYLAQLYAGPSEAALLPIESPLPFRTGAGVGYIDPTAGSVRTIGTVAPGGRAFIQVRAWEAAKGATYEAAQAAGGKFGASPTFSVVTGGGLVPPVALVGLQSFKLQLSSKPTIVTPPQSVTVGVGATARFEVVAGGSQPFSYQWRKGTADIPGATGRIYEIPNVQTSHQGSYSVRVSNSFGNIESPAATLTVAPLPVIAQVIVSSTPLVGRPLNLEVIVTGTGPFGYRWLRNRIEIPGATSSAYQMLQAEAGTYRVRVTGPGGSVEQDIATVSPNYALELSVLAGGTITATPAGDFQTPGTRVTLQAAADNGYAFAGWAGDLSGTVNPTTILMNGHKRVEALFSPQGGTVQFVNRNLGLGFDAPVFDIDGVTRLAGSGFGVQLYAGPTAGALLPVGPVAPFLTGDGAGYFRGPDRAIPTVKPGDVAFVQIRAWDLSAGSSYEAALAAGGKTGASETFSIVTGNLGSPPSPPPLPVGLKSFQLAQSRTPLITAQPASVKVGIGGLARFEVKAVGLPTLRYQWRKGTQNLPGATNSVLEIKAVSAADAGDYFVRVTNDFGFVDSSAAGLEVVPLPVIEQLIVSSPALIGRPLNLEVIVTGTGPFTYQWLRNGAAIQGATASAYQMLQAEAGTYRVRVTGPGGSVEREAVIVSPNFALDLVAVSGGTVTATPAGAFQTPGTVVNIRATAEAGYVFFGWTGDLTGAVNPVSVTMNGHKRIEAIFSPLGGTVHFVNRNLGLGFDARVFDVDGETPVAGDGFVAQLYAGPSAAALAPIGSPVPFLEGDGAGYFRGQDRSIPNVQPGQIAFIQTRAWELAAGATYEAAVNSGGKHGAGEITTVLTGNVGNPPTPPPLPLGFKPFQLQRGSKPIIIEQPRLVQTGLGGTARFEVKAQGTAPLVYQWRKGTRDLAGANTAVLEIRPVADADAGTYSVRITNIFGFADSSPAELIIVPAPTIADLLVSSPPVLGRPLRLEVVVEGVGPFAIQWRRNNADIAGATAAVYQTTAAELGTYGVRVTGPGGTVSRDAVTITTDYGLELVIGRGGTVVATPPGPTYPSGTTVQLLAQPEPGYAFGAWTGDLTGTVNPAEVLMNGHKRVEALFAPTGGTVYMVNRNLGLGIDAPVFDLDGVTRLAGSAYLVQLFAGPTADALEPVGPPLPFLIGEAAGYFRSEDRSIPTVPPGGVAFIQLRAWEAAAGETYAVAVANGGKNGASPTLALITGNFGSPPSIPAFPRGLSSFSLKRGSPPLITGLTDDLTVFAGEEVVLEVSATGTSPLQYQWFQGTAGDDDRPVGTRLPRLVLGNVTNSAIYWVRVSNVVASVDSREVEVTVQRRAQTITFAELPPVNFGSAPVDLVARTSSDLPVGFAIVSGPATVSGSRLTPTGPGSVVIRATQAGNAYFLPAPAVERTLIVQRGAAIITLANLEQVYDGNPRVVTAATVPAGIAIALTYNGSPNPPVNAGSYALQATVTDPNFVGSASGSLVVARAPQAIQFSPPASARFGDAPIPLLASASSGLPVAFEVVGGPALVLEGTPPSLRLNGAGTVRVRALQPGDVNRLPAPPVERSIEAGKATAVITLARMDQVYDGTPRRPDATVTPPGLLVRLSFDGGPTAPSAVGEYLVTATVDDANYGGETTGTLRIVAAINVAGHVFDDLDSSGTREEGEAGIAGVTVRLLELDGTTELRSTTTSGDGAYTFTGVASGSYYLQERNPSGFSSTTPDLRLISVNRDTVTRIDFGDQAVGTVAGTVFEDVDGDGTRDDGEKGIPGVTIRLAGDGVALTATTAIDGSWVFASVNPGVYTVEEIDPAGYVSTTPNVRNVSVAAGGAATAQFGDQASGTIAALVFLDTNGNGVQDGSEPGLPGVPLRLSGTAGQRTGSTGSDGTLVFDDITPGSYTLEEIDPVGYVSTTPNIRSLSLGSGGSAGVSFGDQAAGTISGYVFEDRDGNGLRDTGEPGIAGVTLRLDGDAGLRTTTTSTDGGYLFASVNPGSYLVEEDDPIGFSSTTPNLRTVSVASGGAATASFGDQAAGSVAGTVFEDLDGNGLRDAGEPGIAGVSIRLVNATGQRTTTTSGDGAYLFAGTTPGAYTVEETDPIGFSSTTPNARTVNLVSGGSATANFGDQAAGTVSGTVFSDQNGNGLRESGEPGLGGVLVRLVGSDGQRTTTTTGDGSYQFAAVPAGSYNVEEIDPPGFGSTTPNQRTVAVTSGGAATANFGDQAAGSIVGVVFADLNGNGLRENDEIGLGGVTIRVAGADGQRTTVTSGDGTFQFAALTPGNYSVEETDPVGFASTTPNLRAVNLASGAAASASFGDQPVQTISGVVFEDQNGNGTFDSGEPGIGGVRIVLLDAADESTAAETLTSGSGLFVFADVPAGNYLVRQAIPSDYTVLTGAPPSLPSLHGPPAAPSHVDKPILMNTGGSAAVSFGNNVLGSLSGVVFDDLDGNGTPSAGEPGLGNVRVEVRHPDTGAVLASALTAGTGVYIVTGLTQGSTYEVRVAAVAGFIASDNSHTVSLQAGAATANFALRAAGTVGGRVFNDENGNLVREAGEPGVAGVKVTLVRTATGERTDTTTSADGSFLWTAVTPGELRAEVTVPEGFAGTTPTSLSFTLAAGGGASANFGLQSRDIRPPSIGSEPQDLLLVAGASGTLTVMASGTDPLEYQWLKNGTPLPGKTDPRLEIAAAAAGDAGSYQVRIRNAVGTVYSRIARVTVSGGDAYTTWATQNLPSGQRLAGQDPDGDRLSNAWEYVLGTDPKVADTGKLPELLAFERNGNDYLGFEIETRVTSGVRVFLESSEDLATWTAVQTPAEVLQSDANGRTLRLIDTVAVASRPHRFVRLALEFQAVLAAPAKLTVVSGPPVATSFRLALEGEPGRTYTVERSEDLVTWTFVRTVVAGTTPVTFDDETVTGTSFRFYRAVAR